MECKNKNGIISIALLVVALLIKFLTEWTVWIPVVLVGLAIITFICKSKGECKECCLTKEEKVEETPAETEPVEEEKVEETPAETEPVEEEKVEETPAEDEEIVEEEPKEEIVI